MRREIVLLVVGVVVCLGTEVYGQPWYGGGTVNEPYQIWTAEDMQAIGGNSDYWDAYFILMADIDMGAYTGTSYNIIGINRFTDPFFGMFDGNGHSIFNFTYQSTESMSDVGLFGAINSGGVKNLNVVNPQINVPSASNVGAIAGYLGMNVIIRDCSVSGGTIAGNDYVGGFVGRLDYGSIGYSFNATTVQGDNSVGGIVGYAYAGWVVECYSSGEIIGSDRCGGAIGYLNQYAAIRKCYSTGAVSADSYEGGLVGSSSGRSDRCFWDVTTSNQNSSAEGTGLTTEEMKQVDTYVGWGCSGAWVLDEGVDYPRLIWENTEGDPLPKPSYGGGSGTEEDPYLIYNSEHFNNIGKYDCDLSSHFKLMADIVLDPMVDNNFYPVGGYYNFRGIFDGNYHNIFHPRYSQPDSGKNFVGVFFVINGAREDGIVRNLGIVDPEITSAGSCVGVLAGMLFGGTIENCYVEGGSVSGLDYVGGLAGAMQLWENGLISNSYAITSVSGNTGVGGLVGYFSAGEVNRCFSAGSVSGQEAGGLICMLFGDSIVTDSFWDTTTSGQEISAGGIGLTTSDMQTMSSFTDYGWDFINESTNGTNDIWRMCVDGIDYPRLSYEYSINGDFACPDGVGTGDVLSLSHNWLNSEGVDPDFSYACDPTLDGVTNLADYVVLAENWLNN